MPPQINAISAPYNFVPLSDWVYCPPWAGQVSHDIPFRDGLCGHLALQITAETPVLVGREQEPATDGAPGRVKPYQLPDGRYALPGTALKGMIRNLVEIATFARMGMVDDVRYGLRDISGKYVSAAYTARVRNKVFTGFLRVGSKGLPEITPCSMVRLAHRELERWLHLASPIFPPDRSVAKKYATWNVICRKKQIDPARLRFTIKDYDAVDLGIGSSEGIPVYTGQVSDSTRKGGKQRDFVFFDERPVERFLVGAEDWNAFLFIHGNEATKGSEGMSWPGYWKDRFWKGEAVPVFYLRDCGRVRIGLAYMPRLAGDFSTHDCIGHTKREHVNHEGPLDFAQALFGRVGSTSDACLRGRVTFRHAVCASSATPQQCDPTILNGPKASYFPSYLKQVVDSSTWKLKGQGYATYVQSPDNLKPEVRGWKRYPARPENQARVQALNEEQRGSPKVQVILHPLPKGTEFTTRVDFHNLKHEELGALCWALTFGGAAGLRHGLGMGKPFGFGQLSIAITDADLRCNDPRQTPPRWEECQDRFVEHMEAACQQANRKSWLHSDQVRSVLAMADPAKAQEFKGELRHMRLEAKKGVNEFLDAKKSGLVLAEYPQTGHPPTFREKEQQRRAAEAAAAERERARQAEERAASEAARRQAEFEALPESRKRILGLEGDFLEHQKLGEHQQRARRSDLIGKINTLADQAVTWDDSSSRSDAADLLEKIFDAIGWADPGQNRERRKRQEEKRRGLVRKVRGDEN